MLLYALPPPPFCMYIYGTVLICRWILTLHSILNNAYCVAEPLAGVAFALQSGPVIGPKLGPVPHYNTSRNIGHCGVFSTSTTAIGDAVVSFMQHPVHVKVVICVTIKYCHFTSGIVPLYHQGSQDTKLSSPHFSFCYGLWRNIFGCLYFIVHSNCVVCND